jgi:peptidyl-tRNA hydrolase ICT1
MTTSTTATVAVASRLLNVVPASSLSSSLHSLLATYARAPHTRTFTAASRGGGGGGYGGGGYGGGGDDGGCDGIDLDAESRAAVAAFRRDFTRRCDGAAAAAPPTAFTVAFARSSGPGGQNVNKVNSKVDMRFRVDEATWLPPPVRRLLRRRQGNRINARGELVVASDQYRSQTDNRADCLGRIYELVVDACNAVPAETSASTRARVRGHQRRENERRLNDKRHSKARKESRRGSKGGDW